MRRVGRDGMKVPSTDSCAAANISDLADADRFTQRFDGEKFDPDQGGKGSDWRSEKNEHRAVRARFGFAR
jgi:hypothetical protein